MLGARQRSEEPAVYLSPPDRGLPYGGPVCAAVLWRGQGAADSQGSGTNFYTRTRSVPKAKYYTGYLKKKDRKMEQIKEALVVFPLLCFDYKC